MLELFNISSDLPPPSGETGVRHKRDFWQIKTSLLFKYTPAIGQK